MAGRQHSATGGKAGDRPAGDVTLDRLAGGWWIYQSRDGQRYSTDDLVCAWSGLQARPRARRILDLGAGVGAVGLLALLHQGPEARLVSVEIQSRSAALLARTVGHNGLEQRVRVVCEDLRRFREPRGRGAYDLVLANPPYLQPGRATAPASRSRALARLELNGDVFDYCRAAAWHLHREGVFCFTHAAGDPRPERAVAAAGLVVRSRREVLFRAGKAATIAVYTCAYEGERHDAEPLLVRRADGRHGDRYRRLLTELGLVE